MEQKLVIIYYIKKMIKIMTHPKQLFLETFVAKGEISKSMLGNFPYLITKIDFQCIFVM